MKKQTKVWVNVNGPMSMVEAKAVRNCVQEVCENTVDFDLEQPNICQKQYEKLDDAISELFNIVDGMNEYDEAYKASDVRADIRFVLTRIKRANKAMFGIAAALKELEASIDKEVREQKQSQ